MKKCGIDTQNLIKICSAVEKLNKSRLNKPISEATTTKAYSTPFVPFHMKTGNKRTQALMSASAMVSKKQTSQHFKPALSLPTNELVSE